MTDIKPFNRSEAIRVIADFAKDNSADPVRFEQWLHTLTNEQLQHYHTNIVENAEVTA